MKPGIFAIFGNINDLVMIDDNARTIPGGHQVRYREASDSIVMPRTYEAIRIADLKLNDRRSPRVIEDDARRNYRKRNA